MPEAAFNLLGIKQAAAQSHVKLSLWGYLPGSERLESSHAQPWCNTLQDHHQSSAKVWLVEQWRHPSHGTVILDLAQVQELLSLLVEPAPTTTTDSGFWHKKCVGFCLCRAGSAAILILLAFINSLQPFQSKFATFSFASSCIYGIFLLNVVLLFQKTGEGLSQTASIETFQFF